MQDLQSIQSNFWKYAYPKNSSKLIRILVYMGIFSLIKPRMIMKLLILPIIF